MKYSLNNWLKVLQNMGFEIDEKSKMGSDINLISGSVLCTKNDTFSIYYKVNIFSIIKQKKLQTL
jgi:hypothetical protein